MFLTANFIAEKLKQREMISSIRISLIGWSFKVFYLALQCAILKMTKSRKLFVCGNRNNPRRTLVADLLVGTSNTLPTDHQENPINRTKRANHAQIWHHYSLNVKQTYPAF